MSDEEVRIRKFPPGFLFCNSSNYRIFWQCIPLFVKGNLFSVNVVFLATKIGGFGPKNMRFRLTHARARARTHARTRAHNLTHKLIIHSFKAFPFPQPTRRRIAKKNTKFNNSSGFHTQRRKRKTTFRGKRRTIGKKKDFKVRFSRSDSVEQLNRALHEINRRLFAQNLMWYSLRWVLKCVQRSAAIVGRNRETIFDCRTIVGPQVSQARMCTQKSFNKFVFYRCLSDPRQKRSIKFSVGLPQPAYAFVSDMSVPTNSS